MAKFFDPPVITEADRAVKLESDDDVAEYLMESMRDPSLKTFYRCLCIAAEKIGIDEVGRIMAPYMTGRKKGRLAPTPPA